MSGSWHTLGDIAADRHRLAIHCEACGHFAWADLPALVKRLGAGFPVSHYVLTPRLRCGACGARGQAGIRLHRPEGEGGMGAAHSRSG